MTETFVKYDSHQPNLSSPGFFSSQFMEDFVGTDLSQFEIPVMVSQSEQSENRAIDALSNDSNSSTNYSSKYSPDLTDNNENHNGNDLRRDDDHFRQPKTSSILKKGIQKHYETIIDNNIAYNYEENPSEYKKARKRIQNRESASRVRNKKKNYVEELEDEMALIKQENGELRVQNAALRAENNLLKQQTCFLERMVMKTGPQGNMTQQNMNMMNTQSMVTTPTHRVDQNFEECLLPLVNKYEERAPPKATGYFRAAPPHTFKKHVGMLGLFTILICCYGLIGKGAGGDVQLFYPRSLDEFKNSHSFSVKGINRPGNQEFDIMMENLIKSNQDYTSLKEMAKMLVTTSYIIYFIYVLLITNWRYLLKIKNKKIL